MIRKAKQKIRNYLTAKYDAEYMADLENQMMSYHAWVEEEEVSSKEKDGEIIWDLEQNKKEKAEYIKRLKVKNVHFAWDRYEDKDHIIPKFKFFKEITGWDFRKLTVFVLTNYNTTFEQDLERIYTLRELGYYPYVMVYNKHLTATNDRCRRLQRWCNNRLIFNTCKRFEDYDPNK